MKGGHIILFWPRGVSAIRIMHCFTCGCPAQWQARLCIPALDLTFLLLCAPPVFPVLPASFSAAPRPMSPTLQLCCCRPDSLPPCSLCHSLSCLLFVSETLGRQHGPAAGCRQGRCPQRARLSRTASKPAWDIPAPDCLSGCGTCCHSAASTPSPDQMFCGSAFIRSELWRKLYFCVYFSSACSSSSVIFIHQFLF